MNHKSLGIVGNTEIFSLPMRLGVDNSRFCLLSIGNVFKISYADALRGDIANTKSLKVLPMGPPARSDRHDEPRAFNQFVPVEAAMIDDVFVAGKDPVG